MFRYNDALCYNGGNYCLVGYVFYEVVDVSEVNGRVAHSRLYNTASRLYIRLSRRRLALCPAPAPPRPATARCWACGRLLVRDLAFACRVMDARPFFCLLLQACVSVIVCIRACVRQEQVSRIRETHSGARNLGVHV